MTKEVETFKKALQDIIRDGIEHYGDYPSSECSGCVKKIKIAIKVLGLNRKDKIFKGKPLGFPTFLEEDLDELFGYEK